MGVRRFAFPIFHASVRQKGAKTPSGELKHGACEICSKVGLLHYDHDHKTGEFRGWLCGQCNRGLGEFADNVALLKKAVEYLLANCVADYAERLLESPSTVPTELQGQGPKRNTAETGEL